MDRWNIVATLNYLPHAMETGIVLSKMGIDPNDAATKKRVESMVALADLTRAGFINGDISTVMSHAPSSPGPKTPASSAMSASRSV